MKNLFKILIIFSMLVAPPAMAATSNSSVQVDASVPSEGSSPPINNNSVPVTTFQLVPTLGNVSQNCGQVAVSWQTQLTTSDGVTTNINGVSASTELGYGIDSDSENIITGADGVSHSVTLNNLIIGQTYKYYVRSISGIYEKKNVGGSFTVNCLVANPIVIVDPVNMGAEIKITYPDGGDVARVVVRRSQQGPPLSLTDGESFYDGEKNGFLVDSSILKDQIYWYSVFVCNSLNNCSSGAFGYARRTVSEVSDLSVSSLEKSLNLSWSNPADNTDNDFSFAGIRLIRPYGDCASAGEGDGQILLDGNFSYFWDLDLIDGQNYQYKVFVKNSYGEYSSGLCASGASQPSQKHCPSDISISADDSQITVYWTNPVNEENVFQLDNVRWQKDASCPASKSRGRTVYDGLGRNFVDTDVVNGTVYSYAVFVDYNDSETASCGCVSAVPAGEADLCADCEVAEQSPEFNFFVNSGSFGIDLDSQGQLWVLSGYGLTINTIRSLLPKPVSLIAARFNGENYFLSLDDRQNIYQTTLTVPKKAGDYVLTIATVYQDQTMAKKEILLKVLPWGRIYAGRIAKVGVDDAQIYLKQKGELFFGFGVSNPALSTAAGYYGFMAPNGEYELEIKADGYSDRREKILVTNNIVNFDIDLSEGIDPLKEIMAMLRAIWKNPKVEEINTRYAAPGLAAFAFVSIVTGIPWWNFIRYLQFLFTEPLVWFLRRKKKGWGVIYNSITKNPIDLAVVRLYGKKDGKLLQSKVTDQRGRYNFLVESGEYYLEASKPGLEFPSKILKDAREDSKYTDIYTGQTILVAPNQAGAIIVNIPLDQKDAILSDRQVLSRHYWRNFRKSVSVIGPVAAIISFIISPVLVTGIFVILHLALYALFRRLAWGEKPKRWGVVYSKKANKPLSKVVARIFSPEYNKMLEAQVTDRYGRYGFLAGNNVYYLTAEKEGFSAYRSENIDLSRKRRDEIISKDINLEAAKKGKQEKREISQLKESSQLEEIAEKINQEAITEKGKIEQKSEEKEIIQKEDRFG